MDPSRLMTMPATITPRVSDGTDEYNDEILTDGTPIVLPGGPGNGVWIEQQTRDEGGNVQTEVWRLFAPASVSLDALARIEVDGATYEIDGEPWRATNPRQQQVSHVEATVKRIA